MARPLRQHAALLLALILLALPASAEAGVRHFKLRAGPYPMANFNVAFPKELVPSPHVDGWLTDMDVRLVDRKGRPITIRNTMLHHVVFKNFSRFVGRRQECKAPNGEAFYGTGEERQVLDLPAGYGYRVKRTDRWRMNVMLMSHATKAANVYVEYTGRILTGRQMKRVVPYWVSAHGCSSAPSYPIYGDGGPGSLDTRTFRWHAPINGNIVAAGGHLHGGSVDLKIQQPRCQGRVLFDHTPLYGNPDHLYYRARPILHEPGPINTRWFSSRTGIPIRRGEGIDVTGVYDNSIPHTRVMAITHVYVHPTGRQAGRACKPLPADARQTRRVDVGRPLPPLFVVPLNAMNGDGHIFEINRPPGPVRHLDGSGKIVMRNEGITPANVQITPGTKLTYRFADRDKHNLTFASGPRVAGSPTLGYGETYTRQFTTPGEYKFFCYLHPITMHQVVDVLSPDSAAAAERAKARAEAPAGDPAEDAAAGL